MTTETETDFIGLRVPREINEAITREAERLTVSKSVIVRWAINDYLRRQPQTPGPQSQNTEACNDARGSSCPTTHAATR